MGWFNMSANGTAVSTGTGGFSGYPIFNKGIGEAESQTQNVYFAVGVNTSHIVCNDLEDTGTLSSLVCTSSKIVLGQWYFFTVVRNSTAHSIYIDGKRGGMTVSTVAPTTSSIHRVGIGIAHNSTNTSSGVFIGQVDEIAFFNRSMTGAEES